MVWFSLQWRRFPEPTQQCFQRGKEFQTWPALSATCSAQSSNKHASQRCFLMAHLAIPFTIFWTGKSRPIPFTRWPVFQTALRAGGAQHPRLAVISLFKMIKNTNIAVGRYLISPLAKLQAEGQYAASVSIRSGRGSGTHDLVLRFNGIFDSASAAVQYATEHALGWINDRNRAACV